MATIIPNECSMKAGHPEAIVFDIIKEQFDNSWTVFHSLRNIGNNKTGNLIDAEIDFLFVNAKYGILSLEVKGGNIKHKDGFWYQNENKLSLPPSEQARLNRYNIEKYLKSNMKNCDNISFGFAVCFPNIYSEFNSTPDLNNITLTGIHLKSFEENIISIMQHWNKFDNIIPNSTESAIIKILAPDIEIGSNLIDRIGKDNQQFFKLTEMQCQMLDFIKNHKRVVIRGCAGSGKSILAVKKAKELAENGRTVLLLSYNIIINDRLKEECKEYKNIKVITYHNLCIEKLKIKPSNSHDFWDNELPEKFFEYIVDNPIKYDAVIVDEAQDFKAKFWDSVQELFKNDGWFYIFYDPDQNLYKTKVEIPSLGEEFTLTKNCRNTIAIFDEIKNMATINIEHGKVPSGMPVENYIANSAKESVKTLNKIIHKLINEEGILCKDIVILGGHKLEHTSITNPNIGAFKILENTDNFDKNSIAYYTYYKFKGCESNIVIIIDFNENDKRWQEASAKYTAMSRAKHKLYIINKEF